MTMLIELQERVESMAGKGSALRTIEHELIERAPLDDEQRAALWLYAWTLVDSREPLVGERRSRFSRSR